MSSLLQFLETLPPGPLYALITLLAAVENVFPPVPADTAVALGAFLAGRGVLNPWGVFLLTWGSNVGGAAAVYAVGRRYGRTIFAGRLGRKLLSPETLDHIARQYERHGTVGIFLSRLLPVWRAVVPPFAGVAGVPPRRALVPVALASALWYGALTYLVATVGTNFEDVVRVLGRVNRVLGVVALALVVVAVVWIRRRLRR